MLNPASSNVRDNQIKIPNSLEPTFHEYLEKLALRAARVPEEEAARSAERSLLLESEAEEERADGQGGAEEDGALH